jgi:flavin reductase (DIM6/NTAB) family NADH-FMN oxidoreductase RutF
MNHSTVPYTWQFDLVMKAMSDRGVLLAAYDADGKPNAMTIGWGSIGSIWGMPIWTVLVRPSRHTYDCIQHSRCFSVNVPGADLAEACAYCGSRSGRDEDKLAHLGLEVEKGSDVAAPLIVQCPIIYQCQVVHYNDVLPSALAAEIQSGAYAKGDYHRIYYGKILSTLAMPDAAKPL